MYRSFFGLSRNPFEISPDPYFFFPTARHNEALANLYYGIRKQKGFVVVTGEVGTGKTLLIRCLLETLRRTQIAFAYVFNPRLSTDQFLQYMMGDLGLPYSGKNKSELLLSLNDFLIGRYRRGLPTALIVDEAQQLEADVLEEIRLLTNLETSQQKLMQIVLAGQPELDVKLDSIELRQLKQRIALRCKLDALRPEETPTYIQKRLQLAGRKEPNQNIFQPEAIAVIHKFSQGIPRLINTLCENSLLIAFAVQSTTVTAEMVNEVAADFRLQIQSTNLNGKVKNELSAERRKSILKAFSGTLSAEGSTDSLSESVAREESVGGKKGRFNA